MKYRKLALTVERDERGHPDAFEWEVVVAYENEDELFARLEDAAHSLFDIMQRAKEAKV